MGGPLPPGTLTLECTHTFLQTLKEHLLSGGERLQLLPQDNGFFVVRAGDHGSPLALHYTTIKRDVNPEEHGLLYSLLICETGRRRLIEALNNEYSKETL